MLWTVETVRIQHRKISQLEIADGVNNITNIETDPSIEDAGTIVVVSSVYQVDEFLSMLKVCLFLIMSRNWKRFEKELFVNDIIELQKDEEWLV